MKSISIRFNQDLANWITNCAQKSRINISTFIRNLLYQHMQQGAIRLHNIKYNTAGVINKKSKSKLGYIIFTAKLLEKLVLTSQAEGETLRNIAVAETEQLLSKLNITDQGQRFCIKLEEPLFIWLSNEAIRLQLKMIPLIRMVLEDSLTHSNTTIDTELSELTLQKLAMEHQVIACKLLEKLVHKTIANAPVMIEEIRFKTENVLLQLFP